jgi:hypothetical protein
VSRHSFDLPGQRWTVGFDPPLRSFYAQVEPHPDTDPAVVAAFRERWSHARLDDPDDLLLTVTGDTPAQVRTVAALARVLAEHDVTLPTDLTARLLAEQQTPRAVPAAGPAELRMPGAGVDRVVPDPRAALTAVLRSFPQPPRPAAPSASGLGEGPRPGSGALPPDRAAQRKWGRGR